MIYFCGQKFLMKDKEYNVIDYIQGELTLDSKYVEDYNLIKLQNLKNNILIIDINENSRQDSKLLNSIKVDNYVLEYNNQNLATPEEIANNILDIIESNIVDDYKLLAKVYDKMQDRINYQMYDEIFKKYLKPNYSFLELGAGSGNVTKELIKYKQNILATDISLPLLQKLKQKYPEVKTQYLDITNIKLQETFDCCGMFLDTLNYLKDNELVEAFAGIANILNDNGILIFDIHSSSKLQEFAGYIEEQEFSEFFFNWLSYQSDVYEITHRFMFINDQVKIEKHQQYIYPLEAYQDKFKLYFKLEIIQEIDNRYLLVLRKRKIN